MPRVWEECAGDALRLREGAQGGANYRKMQGQNAYWRSSTEVLGGRSRRSSRTAAVDEPEAGEYSAEHSDRKSAEEGAEGDEMKTDNHAMTAESLAVRAVVTGGDWRASISENDALEIAIDDIPDLIRRAAAHLPDTDGGDFVHSVRLAIKDRMEIAANWFDSTGFDVDFR